MSHDWGERSDYVRASWDWFNWTFGVYFYEGAVYVCVGPFEVGFWPEYEDQRETR